MGSVPPLNTSNLPFPFVRNRNSPMMLRAELPVHMIKILLGRSDVMSLQKTIQIANASPREIVAQMSQ